MQVSLVNPPKIFARNSSGRMFQIAGRAGEIGKFENVEVPDEREIRRLRPVISYLEKLKPKSFRYGSTTGYTKYPQRPGLERVTPIRLNKTDDLPLFKKR